MRYLLLVIPLVLLQIIPSNLTKQEQNSPQADKRFLALPFWGNPIVTSEFDHELPNYLTDTYFYRHSGIKAIGSVSNCTALSSCYDGHSGVDFSLYYKPILAASDGVVSKVGWINNANRSNNLGLRIEISHNNGYKTIYGHLSAIGIRVGDTVRQGQIIGTSGNTGNSQLAHLHFEVTNNLELQVDPYGWVSISVADPWNVLNGGNSASVCLWLDGSDLQYCPSGRRVTTQPVTQSTIEVDDNPNNLDGFYKSCNYLPCNQWAQNLTGYGGDHYSTNALHNTADYYAQWHPNLTAGLYEIQVYVPAHSNAVWDAQFEVLGGSAQNYAILGRGIVDQYYEPSKVSSANEWLSIGQYSLKPGDYVQLTNYTPVPKESIILFDAVRFKLLQPNPPTVCSTGFFKAQYYPNISFNGSPAIEQCEGSIYYDWGDGVPNSFSNFPADNFSVRWQGNFFFDIPGNYAFRATTDDGMRIYVDGVVISNEAWKDQAPTSYMWNAYLSQGNHIITVEFYEHGGGATAHAYWEYASCPIYKGEYYNGIALSGSPLIMRCESSIWNDWGGGAPIAGMPTDNFSIRWTGNPVFDVDGNWQFQVTSDDGVRLWVGDLNSPIIDRWNDQAPTTYTQYKWINSGSQPFKLEYYERGGGAVIQYHATYAGIAACSLGQFKAEYFSSASLSGSPIRTQCENSIAYNWGSGSPSGLPSDLFSARWTGNFYFSSGTYRFTVDTDDGVRIWIDGVPFMDEWRPQSTTFVRDVTLSSSQHEIKVEYYENYVGARIAVSWQAVSSQNVFRTGWENGDDLGYENVIAYQKDVVPTFPSTILQASRVAQEANYAPLHPNGGQYYLRVAGSGTSAYSYAYFKLFDTNITIQTGMRLRFSVYQYQGNNFTIDGHFTDGNTLRDFGGGVLKDQNGVRVHAVSRGNYTTGVWRDFEVDLSPATGKTLSTILVAYDCASGQTCINPFRAYFDNISISY